MKNVLFATCLMPTLAVTADAASLLTNGDFEAGNSGFTSDFTYTPVANSGPQQYTVGTDAKAWNGFFLSFGDNTSGTGNMVIVNGSTSPTSTLWAQTVSVATNQTYNFAGFIASVFSGSPGVLDITINGVSIGTTTASTTAGTWDHFGFSWNSGSATSADIALIETSTAFGGNDYAIDDLSFTASGATPPAVPLPAAAWMLLAGLGGLFGLRRIKGTT